jgi:hypothetical protein
MTIPASELGPDFTPPLDGLVEGNKFRRGRIDTEHGPYFVKMVRDPENEGHRADLENEIRWFDTVSTVVPDDAAFRVPRVVTVSPRYKWAVYEFLMLQNSPKNN